MVHNVRQFGGGLAFPVAIVFATFVLSFPAYAHKLSIDATLSDGHIHGKVYFSTGGAPDLKIQLLDADGKVLEETVSDSDGRFELPASAALPLTLVSETVDGHRGEFVISAPRAESEAEPPHTHAPEQLRADSLSEERVRAIVQEETRALRDGIAEQSERSRARDIFGGIGYIAGVFGLIVLLKRSSGKAK